MAFAGNTVSRRAALTGVAFTSAAAIASSSVIAAPISNPTHTRDLDAKIKHHLDCVKALAELKDPTIRDWDVKTSPDGMLLVIPMRANCRFTGEGIYVLEYHGRCHVAPLGESHLGAKYGLSVQPVTEDGSVRGKPWETSVAKFEDAATARET